MHGIRFNRARNRCGAVIPICLIGLLSDWKKPQTHRLRCVTPRRNVRGTSSTRGWATTPSRRPLVHSRIPTSGSSMVSQGWKPPKAYRSDDR